MTIKHPLDLAGPAFCQHAHEHFAWMRREAPVYHARLTRWKRVYVLTRYDDVVEALKDPRLVKNANNARTESGASGQVWMPRALRPLLQNMLNLDEPDHRRLRSLVHKAFTPRMISQLVPRIEALAQGLLDAAQRRPQVDLIRDFALPLPVTVIADMIGIPPADRPMVSAWVQLANPTPLNLLRLVPAFFKFVKYTRRLADQRRVEPRDDLLTALVQAEAEGDRLSEDELVGTLFLLFVAGHETTVSLIANGTRALLANPEQLTWLRHNPDQMETAVEELLRYDGPLHTTEESFAREPITLHGVTIPQGAIVLPALLSANRDETIFANANQLDLARQPNPHLAFGKGIHYCLGAPLARLEGKIALCALLERSPNLRLAVPAEQLRYQNMMLLHRLQSLPVAL